MRSIVLLICLTVMVFSGCAPEPPVKAEPQDMIPTGSVAVVTINDTEQFRADFRNSSILKSLIRPLNDDSWQSGLEAILELDPPSGSLASFGGGIHTGEWLLVIPEFRGEEIELPPDGSPRDTAEVREPVWQLPDSTSVSLKEYLNLGIVGSSLEYVEEALKNAYNPPPGLSMALRSANPIAQASFFLPSGNLPDMDNPSDQAQAGAEESPNWSVYDMISRAGNLSFQQMKIESDSSTTIVKMLSGQPILPLQETAELIPAETTAWLSYSLQRSGMFRELQASLIGKKNSNQSLQESVEQLSLVETQGSMLLVIHSLNTTALEEQLNPLGDETLEFQGVMISPVFQDQLLKDTFVPLLNHLPPQKFYCRFDDAFILSESLDALQGVISAKNRKDTFSQTDSFKNIDPSLASASSTLLVAKDPANSKLLRDSLSAGSLPSEVLNEIPGGYAVATQLNLQHNFILNSFQFMDVRKVSSSNPEVSEVFTVPLEAPAITRPQFLKNHRSGGMDVAVQDENNVLYLFSRSGDLFWKKELSGPIQGQIHQVDLFRNGRLQMAFTTDTQLLVLDRNGKEVAPFPREFAGGNLGSLAVFDYEKNRNYRLVVTQGSRVFMYNGQGRDVSGFKFRDAGSPVINAPVHIRIGNRDYLVFQLENGTLRILNRVGDTRIGVEESFEFSANPVRYYRNGFAFTDRKGDLIRIDTRGRVNRTSLNLNPDHGMDATSKTLAIMDDNQFQVKANKRELDLGVYTSPRIFYLYDIIYVAVTDLQSQQVYLFRSTAASIPGFPIEGSGFIDMADMDDDRSPELVVPYRGDQIRVYRIR